MTAWLYIALYLSMAMGVVIILFFFYLLLQKWMSNRLEKKKEAFEKSILPAMIRYVADADVHFRPVNRRSVAWKRDVITDVLYQLASVIKEPEEFQRLHTLTKDIGLSDELLQRMQHRSPWIVAEATRNAGKLQLPEAIPIMKQNLMSSHFDVWTASARALSRMGETKYLIDYLVREEQSLSQPMLARLMHMLKDSKEEDLIEIERSVEPSPDSMKGWLLEILGYRQSFKSLPLIERYAIEGEGEVRLQAMRALSEMKMTTKEREIIEYLQSDNWSLKLMAIRVVRECKIMSAIPYLEEMVGDPNWWIRLRSVNALGAFGPRGQEILRRIGASHEDPYARDIAVAYLEDRRLGGEL